MWICGATGSPTHRRMNNIPQILPSFNLQQRHSMKDLEGFFGWQIELYQLSPSSPSGNFCFSSNEGTRGERAESRLQNFIHFFTWQYYVHFTHLCQRLHVCHQTPHPLGSTDARGWAQNLDPGFERYLDVRFSDYIKKN